MNRAIQRAIVAVWFVMAAGSVGAATAELGAKGIIDPDGLLKAYIELGLPLPPPEAPLVRFAAYSGSRGGGAFQEYFGLAFLIEKGDGKSQPLLLLGTQRIRFNRPLTVVDPATLDVETVAPDAHEGPFEANTALATAIQLRARGLDKPAAALLALSLKEEIGHGFSPIRQPANLPPRTALSYLAWSHWMNESVRPNVDRAPIIKRMSGLIAAEPKFKDDHHQELVEALEASLVPSKAKSGSVEGLIDTLVDYPYESPAPKGEVDRDEPNPRILAIALRAFEAIPVLLDHLDDHRLTRGLKGGMMNAPTEHARIGDVVRQLIEELAGDEMDRDYLYRFHRKGEKKAAALPWWDRIKAQGQEAHFVSHVLPTGTQRRYPYLLLLRVIREKYPSRLPEIFMTVLEKRPDVAIHYVAKEVMASSLSRERKLELFVRAADSDDLEQRRAAYWQLKELDPQAFADRLVKTIEGLPRTPKEAYWKCREASFANLAMQTEDPRVWKALADAAKRADVWLRMQYLNPMSYEFKSDAQRRRRLEFLAQFFDDSEVRQAPKREGMPDTKSMYFGPYAASPDDRIEVRDFAAREAGYLLKLKDTPGYKSGWTSTQLAEFRDRVKKAAESEPAK